MKRITKLGIVLAAFCAVIATGCGKDPITPTTEVINSKNQGKIKITLEKNDDYQVITKTAAEPTLADMSVVITNKANGQVENSWTSYTDMDEEIILVSGSYNVSVQNCDESVAAFDAPRYATSLDFEVKIGETASISMIAVLTNVKMTINYDSDFLELVDDVNTVISNGEGVLEYGETESRAGYFSVPADGKLTVTVNCKRISDGQALQKVYVIDLVEAHQWHQINISEEISGRAAKGISINSQLIDKDHNLTLDGNGIIRNNGDNGTWGGETPVNPPVDPIDPGADEPTIVGASYNGDAFDIDQTLTVSAAGTEVLDVEISAPTGGIQNLFVTIQSDVLAPILAGTPMASKFDIANVDNADQELEETLVGLGLINLSDPIKGKASHTFSVGPFMSMLGMLGDAAFGEEHKFIIEVVDGDGTTIQKTLTVLLTR